MSTASFGRLGHLLRWLGVTLVVLFCLHLLALMTSWNWALEPFRAFLVDRLTGESPMALVGLLLMLFGSRLDHPTDGRTPLRWTVVTISGLLALAMLGAIPLSISSSQELEQQVSKSDAALAQQTTDLERQKQQLEDPAFINQLITQGEQSGQLPATDSLEIKQQKARRVIETQLKPQLQRAEQQLGQARLGRDLAIQQRRFVGTGTAVVLAIGFVLLALVALL
ncbi:MAG: HpsJ family protein [Cyanobacteria bacterium]|nr:HpsJ family protein [Cyanobacteriota bacterium]MDA1246771.1 HpsJ family protein [Cyanobacteriota bacterium]